MNDKTNELYQSIIDGDLSKVKALHSNGTDIHVKNDKAFILACKHGHLEIIDYLLNNGANINATSSDNWSSTYYVIGNGLSIAAWNSKWEAFDYLLEKGIKVDLNDSLALKNLILKSDLDRVKILVAKGADVNKADAIVTSIIDRNSDILQYLINETDADIHAQEDLALRNSCCKGNFEIVKKLVQKGANVNAIPVKRDTPKLYGFAETALTCAIAGDNWEIFNYLIENGADPNINNQEPFRHYCKLSNYSPKSKVFFDYYVKNEYVLFNNDIFEAVAGLKDIGLLKFFLSEYSKVDLDKTDLLQSKAIYVRNQPGVFEYLLSQGYKLDDLTKKMLVEDKADFLRVLMKYELANELPQNTNQSRTIKV